MTNNWYVAYVKSCQERKVEEALVRLGIECYLPKQREVHQWSDRKKIVVRMLLPHMIFIRTDELTRRSLLNDIFGLVCYMKDPATDKIAIVRPKEMESFQRMVDYSGMPVRMSSEPLMRGDKVRVLSGPLKGMEYELSDVRGQRCLAVRLDFLGSAFIEFSMDNLEKI